MKKLVLFVLNLSKYLSTYLLQMLQETNIFLKLTSKLKPDLLVDIHMCSYLDLNVYLVKQEHSEIITNSKMKWQFVNKLHPYFFKETTIKMFTAARIDSNNEINNSMFEFRRTSSIGFDYTLKCFFSSLWRIILQPIWFFLFRFTRILYKFNVTSLKIVALFTYFGPILKD